jgi:hypothetical protein
MLPGLYRENEDGNPLYSIELTSFGLLGGIFVVAPSS